MRLKIMFLLLVLTIVGACQKEEVLKETESYEGYVICGIRGLMNESKQEYVRFFVPTDWGYMEVDYLPSTGIERSAFSYPIFEEGALISGYNKQLWIKLSGFKRGQTYYNITTSGGHIELSSDYLPSEFTFQTTYFNYEDYSKGVLTAIKFKVYE